LRLYYVRVGFLASAYVNQIGAPPATRLPRNIAVPLANACALLRRPPILSYDGYALYNWKRFRPDGPIALGNIDTLQNFVHMYDEHWFILVHVEIEAIAARILDAIGRAQSAPERRAAQVVDEALRDIAAAVREQRRVLERIPEKMDPALYYQTFRPYIRFFENVLYEGVSEVPIDFRGETGAQSSVMPVLVAFMKIAHRSSMLTEHLADMRRYMPAGHRETIAAVEAMPDIRPLAAKDAYDAVLEEMARFREVHLGWAEQYVNRRTDDPRGTGGTPYMQWLRQMIDETRAAMIG
jgi:indoleamine 2,3-dioxygenase